MSPKPVIFLSAVSRELKSARQLVANTLTFLGYEPDWQDIFGTEQGDLRAMLRRRIDASAGVVQIVGRCHGAEPPAPDDIFGRLSYTQYEALYARQQGKKVWYLFLDEGFPADPCDPEPEEKAQLQRDYRERVKADAHLYHPIKSSESLETSVLKLRDELAHLRRRGKQVVALVLLVLFVLVLGSAWVIHLQGRTNQTVVKTDQKVDALPLAVAEAIQRTVADAAAGGGKDDATRRTLLFAELEKKHGLPAGTLAAELPEMARKRAENAAIPKMDRAEAAFAALDYTEAERLALETSAEAQKTVPFDKHKLIEALKLAGVSACSRRDDVAALAHLTDASKLTDKTADPLEWARVHYSLAHALHERSEPAPAANLLKEVIAISTDKLGAEHPDTLQSRNTLANALYDQGKYSEAEQEHRVVLKIQERVLGAEHPATLMSGNNLAVALQAQGKNAEAEQEDRAVLKIEERVLGAEHPYTLSSRMGVANALDDQGKHAEAEQEHRAVWKVRERVLGAVHPDTLASRMCLATALHAQGKNAEAEQEDRAVLQVQERVLGAEHSDTLMSRMNLANALGDQGKDGEAEQEHRAVLKIKERVLDAEHPNVANSCYNLAVCLEKEDKLPEAFAFMQRAEQGWTKALGSDHAHSKLAKQGRERIEARLKR